MSDGKVIIQYTGDTSGIDKANIETEQKLGNMGSKIAGIGKAIGAAVGTAALAAGAAFVTLTKRGVELASDLREVQNVVDVTFGRSADKINEWAKTADAAYGLTELSAKQFTGTMGAMLKSMQVSDEMTVEMSTSLAGLAGDFASFYNLSHNEAWEKIRSGISGEIEPLRQLGINLSVANLETFAMSQGITTAYEAMSEADKAMLRWNYLLSVSKDAQGDFARTTDSWANQMRIAKNNVDKLAASLGETLLPAFKPVLEAFNDQAIPKLDEAFKKMAEDGTLDKLGEALGSLAELFSELLADLLPPVIDLFSALLPPLAEIAEKLLPPIFDIVEALVPLVEIIMDILGPLIDMLSGGLAVALGLIADALSIIVGLLGLIIEAIKWITGAETDFDRWINMMTKPFSENGSTYNAINDQMNTISRNYSGGWSDYGASSSKANKSTGKMVSDGNGGWVSEGYTDEDFYKDWGYYPNFSDGSGFYVGQNARGTRNWRGGLSWVGENGPELMNIPRGAQIIPSDISAKLAGKSNVGSSASTVINELYVYPDSKDYARILALLESNDTARQKARAGGSI